MKTSTTLSQSSEKRLLTTLVTCSLNGTTPSGIGGKWRLELLERASNSSKNMSSEKYVLVNQTNSGYLICDSVAIGDQSSLWTQDKTQAQVFLTYERAAMVREHLAKLENGPIVVLSV